MSDTPASAVHVVAALIRDTRGRILLARRTQGRDLAGLWEFPGGKIEAGETPQQALQRELLEELGIRAHIGARIINVPQHYPHKRIHLDVYQLHSYHGHPKGLDGQALMWVLPHTLQQYAMPPADIPVVAALQQPDCYLITPCPSQSDSDAQWLQQLQACLQRGIRRVQLRAPAICTSARWRNLCADAVAICHNANAQVLINADRALAAQLNVGVHLQARQLRDLQSADVQAFAVLAASCHNLDELHHATRLGCAFACLSPVAATASHPQAATLGWDGFSRLREHSTLPLYALGGMQTDDIAQARAHGAQGIAAIRGLWSPSPG